MSESERALTDDELRRLAAMQAKPKRDFWGRADPVELARQGLEAAEAAVERMSWPLRGAVAALAVLLVFGVWTLMADPVNWVVDLVHFAIDHSFHAWVGMAAACVGIGLILGVPAVQRFVVPSADNHSRAMNKWERRRQSDPDRPLDDTDAMLAMSAGVRVGATILAVAIVSAAMILAAALLAPQAVTP